MQPAFLSKLQVRLVDSTWSKTVWELLDPIKYRTMVFDKPHIIEVPTYFRTNFASIPRVPIFWWLTKDVMIRPSVIHDWLYFTSAWNRKMCDLVFWEAGRVENVNAVLRGGMYVAVRMCGGGNFNR